ncbi:MAG: hypothetical protein ACKOPQ_11825 [Novosphingobium sp.]
MALSALPTARAQSVLDTLARSEVTEHWMILPGPTGCGATHRPGDGGVVINGMPSYEVKRQGGRVLSFSPKQAGPDPLEAGAYTVTMAGHRFDVAGEPWRGGAAGLRLTVPAALTDLLARGGEMTVSRADRTVLTFVFAADSALPDELRRCLGGWLPQD